MKIRPLNVMILFILSLILPLSPVSGEDLSPAGPLADQPATAVPNTGNGPEASTPAIPIIISQKIPAVFIPDPIYEFKPVVDGAEVVHEFQIENQGEAPLITSDVRTGCACIVADYPKTLAPGETGKIVIKIDTTGYGGRDFSRVIMVSTNDPTSPMQKVMISGRIDDFAHFSPKKIIILRGKAGDELKLVTTITPDEKFPFTISRYEIDDVLKDLVSIELKKKDNQYEIIAVNKMKTPGRYMGRIHLFTDSTFKPEINMIIRGIVE